LGKCFQAFGFKPSRAYTHLLAGREYERTIPEYPFRKLDRNFGSYAPGSAVYRLPKMKAQVFA
jgi:hypothetical protein